MDYIVTQRFKDKYTGETYLPGMPFKSKEDNRVKDLIDRKLIEEEIVKDKEKEVKEKAKKSTKKK